MEYSILGEIGGGLRISCLGFGCEPLGGADWGKVDIGEVERSILYAVDNGWNYFDTAAVYGLGLSEERLGRILPKGRDDIVVATKVGLGWSALKGPSGRAVTHCDGRPESLRASVEASLKRLGMEAIPMVFLHYPDPAVPVADSVGALDDLRCCGKVRAIGVSNFNPEQLELASAVTGLAAVQLQCSVLNLDGEFSRHSALHWCIEHRVPVIAYGVLARGLLTGKFLSKRPKFDQLDRRSRLPEFQGEKYLGCINVVSQLAKHAKDLGVPTSALAIRVVLEALGVDVALTGIKSPAQVVENMRAMGWVLPDGLAKSILMALPENGGKSRVQS